LRAEAAVVPFSGRQKILLDLLNWCVAPSSIAVRLLTGTGGAGKTRLARELARTMADSGWVAGFLLPDRSGEEMDLSALSSTGTPVLLVVDYAETRGPQLARLLSAVWDASDIAPVRLLLLARNAGDWWTQLRLDYPDPLATATVTPLTALDTSTEDRAAAWQAALKALAARLPDLDPGTDWQNLAETVTAPPDLISDKYGSPLNLQVAALTALLQAGPHPIAEPGDRSREDVLLDHERRYWRRSASERHLNYQPDTLELAVAAATLLGASTEQEATTILARVPGLQDQALDTRLAVARWIADLYPTAHDQYWGALQPDELGERLIVDTIASHSDLINQLADGASDSQAIHALYSLGRLLPREPELTSQLEALITVRFERLAPIALTVAFQMQGPALLADAVIAAGKRASIDHLLRALEQLPKHDPTFVNVGAQLASEAVDRLRHAAEREPDTYQPMLANALTDLSMRLTQLSRLEEALSAAEESVAIDRALAAIRPDEVTPDLARSLSNLASFLSDLGRTEEALAAVEEAARLFEQLDDRPSLGPR